MTTWNWAWKHALSFFVKMAVRGINKAYYRKVKEVNAMTINMLIKLVVTFAKIVAVIMASSTVIAVLLPHYGSNLEAILSIIIVAIVDYEVCLRICERAKF